MPKGEEEKRKSKSKSESEKKEERRESESGSSEAQSSKTERKTSVESSTASALEDKDRKESISSQPTCSSLSTESIVREETEKSHVRRTTIQQSETVESQSIVSDLLQPPAPEKTKASPLKDAISYFKQKLPLWGTQPKKSPTKSPEIEEHAPGQESISDCIVKLPPKDKKTQTVKPTETRNITPKKRSASFLSPDTCEDSETSASHSTADERDLITPSPTPRLDASKMKLSIAGHEPAKPEPGPFQKLRKLMGLEKEEKPLISDQTSIKCEQDTETKSTQTTNMPMSAIYTEGVFVLKDQNRGWASEISTSESVDFTEWSEGTSEHSMDCSSSINADTSGSSPQKSPAKVEAVASSLTDSEKSLQLKLECTSMGEKPVKKMPNPVIEMLKHEKAETVEDEASSTSPRKKDSEECFTKSLPSVQKQTIISETLSTESHREEKMNVEEIEKTSGTIAKSNEEKISATISKSSNEVMSVEESKEANRSVGKTTVKDVVVPLSKISTEVMAVEEISKQGDESCGSVSEADIKTLSISESHCKEMNIVETSSEVKIVVTQTDEKDLSISKSPGDEINVKETSEKAENILAQSDKDFSISRSQEKELNVEQISKDESMDAELDKKYISVSKEQDEKEVIDTSKKAESRANHSNEKVLSFPKVQDKDFSVEAISEEMEITVSASDKAFSISKSEKELNVEENLKESTDASTSVSVPKLISAYEELGKTKHIEKSSVDACGDISQPEEKVLSISSTGEGMNVEVSKVESTVAQSDKKNLSISGINVAENSQESSVAASMIAQQDSLFSISEGFDDELKVKTTSQEENEACGSADQSIADDILLTTSRSKGMSVDNISEDAGITVCKAEKKDLSVSKSPGEEIAAKESFKEATEAPVSQPNILPSTSKSLEKIETSETFKEASDVSGKVASSISTPRKDEMNIEGTAKKFSDEISNIFQPSTSKTHVGDLSKAASEAFSRVTELISMYSNSPTEKELNIVHPSKRTSEAFGIGAQSDISTSTSEDEKMNVEDAAQGSSKTCTEAANSPAGSSSDEEPMDTS